jgi:hypothetical protein
MKKLVNDDTSKTLISIFRSVYRRYAAHSTRGSFDFISTSELAKDSIGQWTTSKLWSTLHVVSLGNVCGLSVCLSLCWSVSASVTWDQLQLAVNGVYRRIFLGHQTTDKLTTTIRFLVSFIWLWPSLNMNLNRCEAERWCNEKHTRSQQPGVMLKNVGEHVRVVLFVDLCVDDLILLRARLIRLEVTAVYSTMSYLCNGSEICSTYLRDVWNSFLMDNIALRVAN